MVKVKFHIYTFYVSPSSSTWQILLQLVISTVCTVSLWLGPFDFTFVAVLIIFLTTGVTSSAYITNCRIFWPFTYGHFCSFDCRAELKAHLCTTSTCFGISLRDSLMVPTKVRFLLSNSSAKVMHVKKFSVVMILELNFSPLYSPTFVPNILPTCNRKVYLRQISPNFQPIFPWFSRYVEKDPSLLSLVSVHLWSLSYWRTVQISTSPSKSISKLTNRSQFIIFPSLRYGTKVVELNVSQYRQKICFNSMGVFNEVVFNWL